MMKVPLKFRLLPVARIHSSPSGLLAFSLPSCQYFLQNFLRESGFSFHGPKLGSMMGGVKKMRADPGFGMMGSGGWRSLT